MKISTLLFGISCLLLGGLVSSASSSLQDRAADLNSTQLSTINLKSSENMQLGAFSISLSVKDLQVSKDFYEILGFEVLGGGMDKNYLIMKNENALVGLFQGMFEGNILTFNPGWDESGQNTPAFDDIRKIQTSLKSQSISLVSEVDQNSSGPASMMLNDPDGNLILIDQHR